MRLQHDKTETGDAELLAEIARTGFCRAVAIKSAAAREPVTTSETTVFPAPDKGFGSA